MGGERLKPQVSIPKAASGFGGMAFWLGKAVGCDDGGYDGARVTNDVGTGVTGVGAHGRQDVGFVNKK